MVKIARLGRFLWSLNTKNSSIIFKEVNFSRNILCTIFRPLSHLRGIKITRSLSLINPKKYVILSIYISMIGSWEYSIIIQVYLIYNIDVLTQDNDIFIVISIKSWNSHYCFPWWASSPFLEQILSGVAKQKLWRVMMI